MFKNKKLHNNKYAQKLIALYTTHPVANYEN